MREIKFRAWDTILEKMLHMKDIEHTGMNFFALCENVSIVKLMQYTGLHDKNGKEIYEGDILQFIDMRSKDELKRIGVVRFHCGSFEVQSGYGSFDNWLSMEYEVIGNIYENPELLEG